MMRSLQARLVPLEGVEAMLTVSEGGRVLSASDQCRSLFGLTELELRNVPNFDALFRGVVPSSMPHATRFVGELLCHDGAVIKILLEKNGLLQERSEQEPAFAFRVAALSSGAPELSSSDSSDDSDVSEDVTEEAQQSLGLYEASGVLGEGFFGSVRLARHKLSGLPVAVKKLGRAQLEELGMAFPPEEVQLLRSIQPHPNLVQLFDVIETASTVYLIQEYVSGGELFDYCMQKGPLAEAEVARLFRQLVRAVSWLHQHGVVHRDLKLENCLLDERRNLKLIDLGLGSFYDDDEHLSTFCGSPDFAAPELYMRKLYLGPPVDVWAMGVILYIMATLFVPFKGPQAIVDIQYSWPEQPAVSAPVRDLVDRIFQLRPVDRPTMAEIRAHPFVALPPQEISEVDRAVDMQIVDQIVVEMGVSRELVLESLSVALSGHAPCNSLNASYKMLKAKKHEK